MRRGSLLLCVIVALALCAGSAPAQVTYRGILLWDACLDANNTWAAQGTRIDWTVSQAAMGGPWTYSYTLTVADDPEISHWILELTPGVTLEDFISNNWPEDDLEFNTFGPSPSNPGFPEGCEFYGVKFDDVEELSQTFVFTTNIAPVWGDFYANGGVTTRVFNESICDPDPQNPPMDLSINCKILRPDSVGVIIPEPNTVILAMLGALPLVGYKIRRRQ